MNFANWALAYYDIKNPNKYNKSLQSDREKARKNFLNSKLDFETALKALETVLNADNTEGVEFLKSKGMDCS